MNKYSVVVAVFGWAFCLSCMLGAQTKATDVIGAKQLDAMVLKMGELVESNYIDAEMGEKLRDQLKIKHQKNKYRNLTYQELGKQLRIDFMEISGDRHMSAFYDEPREVLHESTLSKRLDDWGAPSNYGFVEFKVSKSNIGYLKIGHFGKWKFFEEQKQTATRCIGMLENTNAIIIDVRGNPGGFEDIVAYVVSYFFDQPSFQLQEYYCRFEDRSRRIRTSDNLPGKRLPDIPVYILVDKDTGSAAESLAYIMKHLKRATIVGEKTVGAGNGSTYFKVTDRFNLQIATWETINVVTKTSWEKIGVIPDVTTNSELALEKAIELATEAGKDYRKLENERSLAAVSDLELAITKHFTAGSDSDLKQALSACQSRGIYLEKDINQLGYSLLRDRKQPKTAVVVFKANTGFYPESANVHDSYAEILVSVGKLKEALASSEKAVLIGKKTQDPNLELFVESLDKLKKGMK